MFCTGTETARGDHRELALAIADPYRIAPHKAQPGRVRRINPSLEIHTALNWVIHRFVAYVHRQALKHAHCAHARVYTTSENGSELPISRFSAVALFSYLLLPLARAYLVVWRHVAW